MRVNFLITELRTGGAERCLTELALGLHSLGDRVSVMSLMPLPLGNRDELLRRLLEAGIPVASANARNPLALPWTIHRVRRWLQATSPECLQTFLFHANVIGALAAYGIGLISVGGARVADRNRLRSAMESQAIKRMGSMVCVSQSVEKFVRHSFYPPPSVPVLTIPNGVHLATFKDAVPLSWDRFGLDGSGKVVLFLGRLHRQKGLDILLDVAPSMLKLHADWRLAIVGEGPMYQAARKCVETIGNRQAILIPWQKDVAPLYAASSLVVMPSRYEGMPNVLLEAMATGKAVLAADVEGVAELLGPAAETQTFPPGDRGTFVQKLEQLLTSDDRERLGHENQSRAANEFSIESMVARYRTLYEHLISSTDSRKS